MAMEYIYIYRFIEESIKLKNFKGLQYRYTYDNFCASGREELEITDANGNRKAVFEIERRTCYLLTRRNQSSLQLHKVTPPFRYVDVIPWLFGFGRKHHCCDDNNFIQTCKEFQKKHPNLQLTVNEIWYLGAYLKYAFVAGKTYKDDCTPVAYYYKLPDDVSWALSSKEVTWYFIAEMHRALWCFKYPLQYVIHIFENIAMSYPTETEKFFRTQLGYRKKDVEYHSCY